MIKKNEAGMTLPEVLVAVVIISIALITMLDMFDLGMNITSKSEKETLALFLAQAKMEETKNAFNDPNLTPPLSQDEFTEFSDYPNFKYKVSYTMGTAKTIRVEVKYNNDKKNVVLITKLGERNE